MRLGLAAVHISRGSRARARPGRLCTPGGVHRRPGIASPLNHDIDLIPTGFSGVICDGGVGRGGGACHQALRVCVETRPRTRFPSSCTIYHPPSDEFQYKERPTTSPAALWDRITPPSLFPPLAHSIGSQVPSLKPSSQDGVQPPRAPLPVCGAGGEDSDAPACGDAKSSIDAIQRGWMITARAGGMIGRDQRVLLAAGAHHTRTLLLHPQPQTQPTPPNILISKKQKRQHQHTQNSRTWTPPP